MDTSVESSSTIHPQSLDGNAGALAAGDMVRHLALCIGVYARYSFNMLSKEERKKVKSILEGEMDAADQWIGKYSFPPSAKPNEAEGKISEWMEWIKNYKVTEEKCDLLIDFIQKSSFCLIIDEGLLETKLESMLDTKAICIMDINSCDEKIINLLKEKTHFFNKHKNKPDFKLILISIKAWDSLLRVRSSCSINLSLTSAHIIEQNHKKNWCFNCNVQ
jgi:hypothetical protein